MMRFRPHPGLRCPLDSLPLELQGGSLRCANGHSFDVARQGYVNLLSAQDKRSRDPGDSKAMIAARHRFLQRGHYRPIADSLGTLLMPHLKEDALIVDAGCGEGYYLQQLRERVLQAGLSEPSLLGFDISKWAVQAAGRRFPATWLVASNRRIPLADESADVVMDMFGFPDFSAFARILKPSGVLVRVRAGENHLLELRELIYPRLAAREASAVEPEGFAQLDSVRVQFIMERLRQPAIVDLLVMTPHYFRASADGKRKVAAIEEMSPGVDVTIELYRQR